MSYTLHSAPYTLHPTPYTLHLTPCTLYPTPYTLNLTGALARVFKVRIISAVPAEQPPPYCSNINGQPLVAQVYFLPT